MGIKLVSSSFPHCQERIKPLHHLQLSLMFSFCWFTLFFVLEHCITLALNIPPTFLNLDKLCLLLRVLVNGHQFRAVLLWGFSSLESDGIRSYVLNHDSELLQIKSPHERNISAARGRGKLEGVWFWEHWSDTSSSLEAGEAETPLSNFWINFTSVLPVRKLVKAE